MNTPRTVPAWVVVGEGDVASVRFERDTEDAARATAATLVRFGFAVAVVAKFPPPERLPMATDPTNPTIDGRHACTVAQWAARPAELIDENAYLYNKEADNMGREGWRVVASVDPVQSVQAILSGGRFDVWFHSGVPFNVAADFVIYATAEHHAILTNAAKAPQ